jgi:hypothetical protein
VSSPFDSPLGSGGLDVEAVRERLKGMQESAEQRAAATQELADGLASLSATASDEAR